MDEQKKTDELGTNETPEAKQPDETEQAAAVSDGSGAEDNSSDDSKLTEVVPDDVSDVEEVEEPVGPPVYQSKLTPTQSKVVQTILGVAAGAAIWIALYFGGESENTLFSWLWVIIFAVVMFGRNYLERSKGMNLRIFMKAFLIGLVIFLGLFIIYGVASGKFMQS